MNKRQIIRLVLILIVAAVGYLQKDRFTGGGGKPSSPPPQASEPTTGNTVVRNMQIRDMDGSVAYRGDVDLGPTLARIEDGKKDPHENDGAVFGNRERLLPVKERGYYREYVVRTPGIRHAGPQRLVIGKAGEVYYTPDHYQSFRKISP